MRISLSQAIAALTIGLIALIAALAMLAAAYAAPASPSPSVSPSATPAPLPTPAGPELVAWATKWKHRAQDARRDLCRVRSCFGDHMPARLSDAPQKGSGVEAWTKAGRHWRHQARDWRAKVREGRRLMTQPPGPASGAKWLPLARWVGWPERPLRTLAGLIWYESSGIKDNISPTHDYGLTQINRCNAGLFKKATGKSFYNGALNPELNLTCALYIWRSQGCRFKPAWARDPAVEAVE